MTVGDPGAESSFWKSVRELAAMRSQIPDERRRMSAVRAYFATATAGYPKQGSLDDRA